MSQPSQEVAAVNHTRELLYKLLADPECPTWLRKELELCSKHFPLKTTLEQRYRNALETEAAMMKGPCPDWLAELIGWRDP